MTDEDLPVEEMVEDLQEEWGQVYIAYRGPDYYDGQECIVRNQTDEGLPVGTARKQVSAPTLVQAIRAAHDRHVSGGAPAQNPGDRQ